MSVLLLRLAGPLQSWGEASRFSRRETRTQPTKSGVLGLLAAAQGRRRSDPIEDLLQLRFGVRIDQPGRLVRDFQTAIRWETGKSMPLSYRYYLADAVFVAGVEGEQSFLNGLDEAVRSPHFPLFLGRRACPPTLPLSMGVVDSDLASALQSAQWQASQWYRKSLHASSVSLEITMDSVNEEPDDTSRDVPLSWNPERREYGWRNIVHAQPAVVPNPDARERNWGKGSEASQSSSTKSPVEADGFSSAVDQDEPDFMAAVAGGS